MFQRLLLLPVLLIVVHFLIEVQGQENEGDFHLGLTAEWIEVDLADLPALIQEHGGDFDAGNLYAKVVALIDAGKAERTELVYGRICPGQPFSFGSGDELIYATAFETDYEGLRIEIDPVAGPDESTEIYLDSTIQWSVLKEKVSLAADSSARAQKPLADKWQPIFTVIDLTSVQTAQASGEVILLHTARSPQDPDQTALIFLTAWILD